MHAPALSTQSLVLCLIHVYRLKASYYASFSLVLCLIHVYRLKALYYASFSFVLCLIHVYRLKAHWRMSIDSKLRIVPHSLLFIHCPSFASPFMGVVARWLVDMPCYLIDMPCHVVDMPYHLIDMPCYAFCGGSLAYSHTVPHCHMSHTPHI